MKTLENRIMLTIKEIDKFIEYLKYELDYSDFTIKGYKDERVSLNDIK